MTNSSLNELSYHPLLAQAKAMEKLIKQTDLASFQELRDNQRILCWLLFIVAGIGFMF